MCICMDSFFDRFFQRICYYMKISYLNFLSSSNDLEWMHLYYSLLCAELCAVVLSRFSPADSATVWTVSHLAPVHGVLQERIPERAAVPSSRGSPRSRITPATLCLPQRQASSLPLYSFPVVKYLFNILIINNSLKTSLNTMYMFY